MAKLEDTAWVKEAKKYIGVREIKGPHHDAHILKWWKNIGAPFKDDETPWCGAFVGGVMSSVGIKPPPGGASARAYLKMKVKLDKPAVGCVVIFWRGTKNGGNGHVAFVIGKDQHGNLMCLGGNQGDTVSVKPFDKARVLGYRWPGIYPYPERFKLPIVRSDGSLSNNEV